MNVIKVSSNGLLFAEKTGNRVVFKGGLYGQHSITTDNKRRIEEHWNGYCQNNQAEPFWNVNSKLAETTGKWSGKREVEVGEVVTGMCCNQLALVTIVGFVDYEDFAGVLVRVSEEGTNYHKQNPGNPISLMFGAELKLAA